MSELVPILGVIFSLSIPMVVMYFVAKMVINEKNRDKEIRQLIIEHDMDAERAKLLIKEKRDNNGRYPALRWGCFLMGAGFGALAAFLLNMATDSAFFYLTIAFGCGLGLLVSFLIEMKVARKEPPTQE
jgi:mannitol-specific phosphotransferase system IIBC component